MPPARNSAGRLFQFGGQSRGSSCPLKKPFWSEASQTPGRLIKTESGVLKSKGTVVFDHGKPLESCRLFPHSSVPRLSSERSERGEYLENGLTYRTAKFYTDIHTDILYNRAGYDVICFGRL